MNMCILLLLYNIQGYGKCHCGHKVVIRKYRDMFFNISLSSRGIHRNLNLPYASRFKAIRTNHRGCTASAGLNPINHQGFLAHTVDFKDMLSLFPLEDLAKMVCELIYRQFRPGVFLGPSD